MLWFSCITHGYLKTQELYFIMSYANGLGWKGTKGERGGIRARTGGEEKERIKAREGEEVWGGEQIDYRLEQMAQQVRAERNFSFFHCKPHSVHFWQSDLCACGRVLTPAL